MAIWAEHDLTAGGNQASVSALEGFTGRVVRDGQRGIQDGDDLEAITDKGQRCMNGPAFENELVATDQGFDLRVMCS